MKFQTLFKGSSTGSILSSISLTSLWLPVLLCQQTPTVHPDKTNAELMKMEPEDRREFFRMLGLRDPMAGNSVADSKFESAVTEGATILTGLPAHMAGYDYRTSAEAQAAQMLYRRRPNNIDYVLYQRFPKSGSTSIRSMMKSCSKLNVWTFQDDPEKNAEDNDAKIYERMSEMGGKFFSFSRTVLLSYHYWMNVTDYSKNAEKQIKQPTFVTFIPEPISWFSSKYYSCRYGHKRNPEPSGKCRHMLLDKLEASIDQCIENADDECNTNTGSGKCVIQQQKNHQETFSPIFSNPFYLPIR